MKRTFERILFPAAAALAFSAALLSCDDMYHEARAEMDGGATTLLVSDILFSGGPFFPGGDPRVPQNIYFNDHDPTATVISGEIMLIPPLDETGIYDYTVYWGSSATTKLGGPGSMPIAIMTPIGNTIIQSLGASLAIPIGATHLLAYVDTMDGENATPASVKITDISITPLDIVAGSTGSNPLGMTVFNSKLYFAADDSTYGRQLFEYNDAISFLPGTNPATHVINSTGASNPANFAVYNNKLYFQATDGFIGSELFSINISSGITSWDINDFAPTTTNSSFPSYLTVFNSSLFFSAAVGMPALTDVRRFDESNIQGYLVSLGVATNTNPAYLCVYDGQMYLSGNGFDGAGIELWKMTVTYITSRVWDIFNGAGNSNPSYLTAFNGKLYFQADNGTSGAELWVYDDKQAVSGANPVLVRDINPGGAGSFPKDFIVYNSRLYFQADNGTSGAELWVYDDKLPVSGSNPAMVTDIAPGTGGSTPDEFSVFNNKLFFWASSGGINNELWVYDDRIPIMTGFNPVMVSNLWNGGALVPADPVVYNNRLYFSAFTTSTGDELWVYEER